MEDGRVRHLACLGDLPPADAALLEAVWLAGGWGGPHQVCQACLLMAGAVWTVAVMLAADWDVRPQVDQACLLTADAVWSMDVKLMADLDVQPAACSVWPAWPLVLPPALTMACAMSWRHLVLRAGFP